MMPCVTFEVALAYLGLDSTLRDALIRVRVLQAQLTRADVELVLFRAASNKSTCLSLEELLVMLTLHGSQYLIAVPCVKV